MSALDEFRQEDYQEDILKDKINTMEDEEENTKPLLNNENTPKEMPQIDNGPSANLLPLNPNLISKSLSMIDRTGDGLSYAYTRLEIHDRRITNLDILENYPHLRYIVIYILSIMN